MLNMKLMLLLVCDLVKRLLKKIIHYPEYSFFFRHSEDDPQNKDGSGRNQPEDMNFEAATTSVPSWLNFQVPVVVPVVIDTEAVKKQLPVMQYRDIIEKKSSRKRQFQTTSLSSEEEEILHMSSCIVCRNSMEGTDEVRELRNCEHVFHKDCLDAWIGQAHLTCPLCRSELLIPATTSTSKLNGGRDIDPWRAERMTYLFGQDIFFTS